MKLIKLRMCADLTVLDLDNVSHILCKIDTPDLLQPDKFTEITLIYLKQSSISNPDHIYVDASIDIVLSAIKIGIAEGYIGEHS